MSDKQFYQVMQTLWLILLMLSSNIWAGAIAFVLVALYTWAALTSLGGGK